MLTNESGTPIQYLPWIQNISKGPRRPELLESVLFLVFYRRKIVSKNVQQFFNRRVSHA